LYYFGEASLGSLAGMIFVSWMLTAYLLLSFCIMITSLLLFFLPFWVISPVISQQANLLLLGYSWMKTMLRVVERWFLWELSYELSIKTLLFYYCGLASVVTLLFIVRRLIWFRRSSLV